MKRFLIHLLMLPSLSFSEYLPNHFGSSVGIITKGEITYKQEKYKISNTTIEVDFSSSKLFRESLYLSSFGILGKNISGLGFSVFAKLSDYFYLGGSFLAKHDLKTTKKITGLYSFRLKDYLIEPYLTVNYAKENIAGLGIRFFLNDKFSIQLGAYGLKLNERSAHFIFSASVPVHNFSAIEALLDAFKNPASIEKEIENLK